MTLARKIAGLTEELRRRDNTPVDKLFRVAQKTARALHLTPGLNIARCVIVECTQPPKATRGLSDLRVRRGEERDVAALADVDKRDPDFFRARLAKGDFVYLGQLGGQVLCHTWFHRGPSSFEEERAVFAPWALDASSFWSYDAMTRLEARRFGVAAKLLQVALGDIFALHGAQRVRGFIYDDNHPSLILHQRMGFTTLGTVTALALPGVKWVRWESGGARRQWLLRRNSEFALPPSVA